MIFQNQQANILRVNGALADNFANRPASQGTYYIFYSLDTQEIFYDDVTGWILLGSGGGGTPVNIYNSDGTLNSDRTIDAAMQSIDWINFNNYTINNFNSFRFFLNGYFIGIFSSPQFFLHRFGEWNQIPGRNNFTAFLECNINTGISKLSGNDTINFMDLQIGNSIIETNINTAQRGIKITTTNALLGEELSGNNVFLEVIYAGFIKTNFLGSNIGLNFDFTNSLYQFGQLNGGNVTRLLIDDTNRFIKTSQGGGQDTGIRLDFLQRQFDFGQITGGNFTYLSIDDVNNTIQTIHNAANKGLYLDFTNRLYEFGNGAYNNKTRLVITDTSQSIQLQSNFQIGLSLDFLSNQYEFGNSTAPNATLFKIYDSAVYPLQISGTNVISGTSSGSSGQHLKIKINGIDYKIRLENP